MSINVDKLVAAVNQVIAVKRRDLLWEVLMASSDEPLYADGRPVFDIQENQYYIGTNAFISSAWQGYVKRDKQAKGAMDLEPSKILQRRHMLKVPIFPDDIRGTIQGQLAKETDDITVKDIVKYMIDGLKMRISDDRVSLVIYKGKYQAYANGQVWPAEHSVNGYSEIIEAGLEAANPNERINSWNVGPIDEDLIYKQIREMVKQTPAKYRKLPMNFYLADSLHMSYREQREEEIGLRVMTDDKNAYKLKDTNWTFRPSVAMEGSKRLFATAPGNMVRIHDIKKDLGNIEAFKKDVDEVTLHANWCEAYGFDFNKLVWANKLSNSGSGGGEENETFV